MRKSNHQTKGKAVRLKTVNLDDQTKGVLLRSRIDGNNLFLPGQLPRDEYAKVAKAIEVAGGKWNRKAGCHVFPHDVRETLNIGAETVSVTNVQQTFQSFYTPPELAARMARLANIQNGDRVLEPSAGMGNLLKEIRPAAVVVAVEVDPRVFAKIEKLFFDPTAKLPRFASGSFCACSDFLECNGGLGLFDKIIMNPPFSRGDDIKHIRHALGYLKKDGGRLVAICANGPKQREAFESMAYVYEELPAGTFSESGTEISTVLVVIES